MRLKVYFCSHIISSFHHGMHKDIHLKNLSHPKNLTYDFMHSSYPIETRNIMALTRVIFILENNDYVNLVDKNQNKFFMQKSIIFSVHYIRQALN